MKNVSFKYNEDESTILKDINLNINKGDTVAFVGMSGGGKSTLINLIPRFYDVSEGEILIDDYNVKDFLTGSLRNQIGLVQQDNILFSDTVRENILLGRPDATEEEVIEAAKMANAHEFIMNLHDGYDTEVGERGVKLSGGQKAKVFFTKMIMDKAEVIVLDEPTRNLSPLSQPEIIEALSNYNGCIIAVSHDRRFIHEVFTTVYELDADGLHRLR